VSNPGTWQDLVINGANFLGINKLGFSDDIWIQGGPDGNGTEILVDPRNPPAGITFAADGTRITISGSYLYQNVNNWLGAGAATTQSRFIHLHTANLDGNGTAVTTPLLKIDPTWNDSNP
jgi:hypothetical protein